ncbi:MAG TPA: class I SAM-dependent methyltransferase [Candidatus Bathyarchaeia archaeon]|nr:class I SAM-dependent methyltransferase [Candidatus Bathyarchaeia archaeon]
MATWVEYFKKSQRNLFSQFISKRRLIELIISETPKCGKILEAGCGTADLSIILASCGYAITAMDLSEDVLEYAQKKTLPGFNPINFFQADILNLSEFFEKKHFDTVCHSGVLEHFSDYEIIKALKEQKFVANKIIFNVPNNRVKPSPSLFGDERLMSNKKWSELISKAGFVDHSVYGGYDLPIYFSLFLPNVFFRKELSFWWKWFSRHSIFICRS